MSKNKDILEMKEPLMGKYKLIEKMKTGGFGKVYYAQNINDRRKQYAVKIIPQKNRKYAAIETKMYDLISQNKFTYGFVKHYQAGQHQGHFFQVMELLGDDLEEMTLRSRKLTVKTALMVGLQAIDRIQALHKIGYLHRDIKPDNLAIGRGDKSKIVYLIDFGLTKKIGEEQSPDEMNKAVGTLAYMSLRAHQGKLQGRADDLECLIYTLAYMILGTLPWMKLKLKDVRDFHRIKLMKEKLRKQLTIAGRTKIPVQLLDMLEYTQNLKQNDIPDYLKIKFKFIEALKDIDQENDFNFDWCRKQFQKLPKPLESMREIAEMVRMKEHNQQIVQGEIYEVYKFIDGQKEQGKSPRKSKSREKKKQQSKLKPKSKEKEKQKQKQSLRKNQHSKQQKQTVQNSDTHQLIKQKKQFQKFLLNQPENSKANLDILKIKPQSATKSKQNSRADNLKSLRPESAKRNPQSRGGSRPQSRQRQKPQTWKNPWQEQMQKMSQMHFEAPRIVINKTAKHKI